MRKTIIELVMVLMAITIFAASFPTIPNTFQALQVISSAKINANYQALLNGITDGTKKISVGQLLVGTGNVSVNGTVSANTFVGTTFTGGSFVGNGSALTNIPSFITGNAAYGAVVGAPTASLYVDVSGNVVATKNVTINGQLYATNYDSKVVTNSYTGNVSVNGTVSANTLNSTYAIIGRININANTIDNENNSLGLLSLASNTSGYNNNALGYRALYSNTTGIRNNALGLGALDFNTTGSNNHAIGFRALYSNTTGSNNHAIGYQALYSNTTGTGNVAIGYQSGYGAVDSDKLYISNSSGTPLIGGDFAAKSVTIDGMLTAPTLNITAMITLTPIATTPNEVTGNIFLSSTNNKLWIWIGGIWNSLF